MTEVLHAELLTYEYTTFIDDDNLNAYYYPEKKLIHIVWKQRTIGEDYRNAFLGCVEFAKSNPSNYFLSDIRQQGVVGPEDRKWFETVALPAAIDVGLQKSAAVFDGNVFKMYYINMILQHVVKKGIPMKFFKDLESAQKWLFEE
jgi:hypothetical protein